MAGITTVDTLIFELKVDDQASKAFDSFDKRFKRMKDDFVTGIKTSIIPNMKQAGRIAFDFGKESVQAFGEFQQGMADISKTSGATGAALDELGDKLRQVVTMELKGTSTIEQLQQIAAMGAKFGVATEELDSFSGSIAKMSSLWDINAQKTAETTAKIIAQYQLTIENVEQIGSAVDMVADSFATSEEFILRFMQNVSGTAKSTNQSLGDIAGMAAQIAVNTGMAADAASSSYEKILSQIQRDAPKFAQALGGPVEEWARLINTDGAEAFNFLLQRMGNIRDTQGPEAFSRTMKDLFGTNIRVERLLKGMIGTVDDNRKAMELGNEAYKEGTRVVDNFNTSIQTQQADITQVQAQWKNFSISVGKALAPALAEVIGLLQERLMPALADFGKWLEQNKGLMADVFKFLADAAELAFTAIAKGGEIAGTAIAEIGFFIEDIIDGLKKIGDVAKSVFSGVAGFVGKAKDAIVGLISKIGEAIEKIRNLGRESHEESTFPDMHRWILRNIDSVRSLAAGVDSARQSTASLGRTAAQVGTIGGNGLWQPSRATTRTTSPSTSPSASSPTVQAAPSTTVVFQGINIVDESSKNRFTRYVTKSQQNLRSHVVYG